MRVISECHARAARELAELSLQLCCYILKEESIWRSKNWHFSNWWKGSKYDLVCTIQGPCCCWLQAPLKWQAFRWIRAASRLSLLGTLWELWAAGDRTLYHSYLPPSICPLETTIKQCLLQCGASQLLLAIPLCAPSSKDFATALGRVLLPKQGNETLLLGWACSKWPPAPRSCFLQLLVFAAPRKL